MTKSLHSEIVFHFTTKNGLYGILEHTFHLSFCKERIVRGNSAKALEFGVPMVSFCDLKLSELRDHMDKYGKYGIGLSKDWALRYGLNPVFYINGESNFTKAFIDGMETMHKHIEYDSDNACQTLNNSYNALFNTYRFIKNYQGNLIRSGKVIKRNYRFADEREWRYVPSIDENFLASFVSKTMINTKEKKRQLNEENDFKNLPFEPEDIKYLVIESDAEISEIVSHLKNVKRQYSDDEITRLTTRILNSEQIYSDI